MLRREERTEVKREKNPIALSVQYTNKFRQDYAVCMHARTNDRLKPLVSLLHHKPRSFGSMPDHHSAAIDLSCPAEIVVRRVVGGVKALQGPL